MTARIFVDLMMGFPALHSKITHLAIESGVGGNETQTISEIRKNEEGVVGRSDAEDFGSLPLKEAMASGGVIPSARASAFSSISLVFGYLYFQFGSSLLIRSLRGG